MGKYTILGYLDPEGKSLGVVWVSGLRGFKFMLLISEVYLLGASGLQGFQEGFGGSGLGKVFCLGFKV